MTYHNLDVAACGLVLLDAYPWIVSQLADITGLTSESVKAWVVFLLAIHDQGKIADSFQNLNPDLFLKLKGKVSSLSYTARHDRLGFMVWEQWGEDLIEILCQQNPALELEDIESFLDILDPWMRAVTGHHGVPPEASSLGKGSSKPIYEQCDEEEVLAWFRELASFLAPEKPLCCPEDEEEAPARFQSASWLVAGVAVIADWLGSNQEHFPFCEPVHSLPKYWEIAQKHAQKAWADSGLSASSFKPFHNFQSLFPAFNTLTPLQVQAENLEISKEPQLWILEETTGGGKTEAAFALAHRMIDQKMARGIFMALPTMATANAMFERVVALKGQLFDEDSPSLPNIVLAHSASKIQTEILAKKLAGSPEYSAAEKAAPFDANTWVSDSRKKALLADLGAGTIDQALLGALPFKHQSIRLLGLASKVLIVDEVHACDTYMHKLLCRLLEFHAAHGGSAILLSATLPRAQRKQLLEAFAAGVSSPPPEPKSSAYPLITSWSPQGLREVHTESRREVARTVNVEFVHKLSGVNKPIRKALAEGACVCWVRNTVKDAIQAYHFWCDILGQDKVTLFHSRFALGNRQEIETDVLDRFGKKGGFKERNGQLLIATQVVEQSLDLDFDVMFSDLAPADLLIQRAGRMKRHVRDRLGNVLGPGARDERPPATLYLVSPDPQAQTLTEQWFSGPFPGGAAVYPDHGMLWRTAAWLQEKGSFSMPEDAREWIEYVYNQDTSNIPEALLQASRDAHGERKAQASQARVNLLTRTSGYESTGAPWRSDENTPTRLGEPTVQIRLVKEVDGTLVPWFESEKYAWHRSELRIRACMVSAEIPDPAFETLRQNPRDQSRYRVLIKLHQVDDRWEGEALGPKQQKVSIVYSELTGFAVNQGG